MRGSLTKTYIYEIDSGLELDRKDYVRLFERVLMAMEEDVKVPLERKETYHVLIRKDGVEYNMGRYHDEGLIKFLEGVEGVKVKDRKKSGEINVWRLQEILGVEHIRMETKKLTISWELEIREGRLVDEHVAIVDKAGKLIKEEWEEIIRQRLLMDEKSECLRHVQADISVRGGEEVRMSAETYKQLCSCPVK